MMFVIHATLSLVCATSADKAPRHCLLDTGLSDCSAALFFPIPFLTLSTCWIFRRWCGSACSENAMLAPEGATLSVTGSSASARLTTRGGSGRNVSSLLVICAGVQVHAGKSTVPFSWFTGVSAPQLIFKYDLCNGITRL